MRFLILRDKSQLLYRRIGHYFVDIIIPGNHDLVWQSRFSRITPSRSSFSELFLRAAPLNLRVQFHRPHLRRPRHRLKSVSPIT